MGRTVVSFRLDDELVGWVAGYAGDRGVPKTEIFEAALREYRELCAGGVPDLQERGEQEPPREVEPAGAVGGVTEPALDVAAIRAKAAAAATARRAGRS